MSVDDIVTEVSRELGVPNELIERAKVWATVTALSHSPRASVNIQLSERDAHIVRMYFRTLIYRMANDPDYRRELEMELQRRVERN